MALINKFTTDSGLELDLYYCVTSIDTRGHIALDGYVSKEARDEGKSPVNRVTYSHVFPKQEINLENVYNFVKEQQEFSNSKDA